MKVIASIFKHNHHLIQFNSYLLVVKGIMKFIFHEHI